MSSLAYDVSSDHSLNSDQLNRTCAVAATGVIVNTILPNGQPAQTRVPVEVAIQMIRNQQLQQRQQRTPALNRVPNPKAPKVLLQFLCYTRLL